MKLLVQSTAACHAKSTYEFFEVDSPVLVDVEYVENIVCEFSGIAKGEELFVYADEFDLVKLA